MTTNTPDLFPIPHRGSHQWQTYRVQRREHGDRHVMCPDSISEAEKLFGISDSCMSYVDKVTGYSGDFTSCNYRELQKQQNKDWAQSIAQSMPAEPAKNGDWRDILDKLDHALTLDPECAMALSRRAKIYIHTGRISRAQADIKILEQLVATADSNGHIGTDIQELERQIDDYISSKQRSERHHNRCRSGYSEKHDSSSSRANKRRHEYESPSRYQNRRSRNRSRSHSRRERH